MRKINSHQTNWKQVKTLGNAVFLYFDPVSSFMLLGLDEDFDEDLFFDIER